MWKDTITKQKNEIKKIEQKIHNLNIKLLKEKAFLRDLEKILAPKD